MEESEKRRERLKAMRMEAAQADASSNIDTSTMPAQLSNPFAESSATTLVQESSPAPARFDFYTDPMAAFSSNKRKIKQNFQNSPSLMPQPPSSHLGPRNLDMTPPSHQFHIAHSAEQRMYEAPFPYQGSSSWRSLVGMATPSSGYRGASPGVWSRSGGTASYGLSPNSSRPGGFASPGFARGGSYSGSPKSGRGSGSRFSNNSSPHWGRGGGRGRGFHASVSARESPELFYSKSMTEDPWSLLIPVVKNLSVSAENQNSWLPKSITMKKVRVSESASTPNSQLSLADCLSAAFEEAANDAAGI